MPNAASGPGVSAASPQLPAPADENIECAIQDLRITGLPLSKRPNFAAPKYYFLLHDGKGESWKSREVVQRGTTLSWGEQDDRIELSLPASAQLQMELFAKRSLDHHKVIGRLNQSVTALMSSAELEGEAASFDLVCAPGVQLRVILRLMKKLKGVLPGSELDRVVKGTNEEFARMQRAPERRRAAQQGVTTVGARGGDLREKVFDALLGQLDAFTMSAAPGKKTKTESSNTQKPGSFTERQAEFDNQMENLLTKMNTVYKIIQEAMSLEGHGEVLSRIVQQTIDCGRFIYQYAKDANFALRRRKYSMVNWEQVIEQYFKAFNDSMSDFTGLSTVQREIKILGALETAEKSRALVAEDRVLKELPYATYARYERGKQCLPTTRTQLLGEIKEWIESDGSNVPRLYFLHGSAGAGKSTIAHSIAAQYDDQRRLGSSFVIRRAYYHTVSDILPTIARDLADLNPSFKAALILAIQGRKSHRNISDLREQLDMYILRPCEEAVFSDTVVIVLDGLDELGPPQGRAQVLALLGDKAEELPPNFRILITARAEGDIMQVFQGLGNTCRMKRMPTVEEDPSLKGDILNCVRYGLRDKRGSLPNGLPADSCEILATKAEGLFQWAFVACEYIKVPRMGSSLRRYNQLTSGDDPGLDGLYKIILEQLLAHDLSMLHCFTSIMGFLLTSMEPLCMRSLRSLLCLLGPEESFDVDEVLPYLGSLLTGIGQGDTIPVRPLHSSFVDWIQSETRGGRYYVGLSGHHERLATSSLRMLNHRLHFNMGQLTSSYHLNRDVLRPDGLKTKIEQDLSYACKHWGYHLSMCKEGYEGDVAELLRDLLMEKFLFWIDATSIAEVVAYVPGCLTSVISRLRNVGVEVSNMAEDGINFVRVFSRPIVESAPHVYLSALIWSPPATAIAETYCTRHSRIARLVSGTTTSWPSQLSLLGGHNMVVTSVAFSPDGKRIVSGSQDGTIRFRDAETGRASGTPLEGHGNFVVAVVFSPDGKQVLSASWDKTIRMWNAETGNAIGMPLEGHESVVSAIAFSPDGKWIVSGSWDATIRMWDAKTGHSIGNAIQGHENSVTSVAFSPDCKRLVSASFDSTIRMWDAETGRPIGTPLEGHKDAVSSVAFSPDGKRIVSSSWDTTIRMWNVETGCAIGAALEGHDGVVTCVSFSPNGKLVVSASHDRTIRIWDSELQRGIGSSWEGHEGVVTSVAFSPDGKRVVSGSEDMTIRMWNVETEKPSGVALAMDGGTVTAVTPLLDGKRILSGSTDGRIRMWDVETGRTIGVELEGHSGEITSVAVSPNGKILVSGSEDRTLQLWNTETWDVIGEALEGHDGDVTSVAFSWDGQRIVSASADRTIRMWDAETGNSIGAALQGHEEGVRSVAFSPDGKRIVSGSENWSIRVWDAETGLAIGAPLEGHANAVNCVAFSPDGSRFVSASEDSTIRIWDTTTMCLIGVALEGHKDAVTSVAFSPDGKWFVSGSSDWTVRIWDAETGRAMGEPLEGHENAVTSVAFLPDGKRVLSGSSDGTVRVWDVETCGDVGGTQAADATTPSGSLPLAGSRLACKTRDVKASAEPKQGRAMNRLSLSPDPRHQAAQAYKAPDEAEVDIKFDLETGWIIGNEKDHLLWVPPEVMPRLYQNGRLKMIMPAERMVTLDLSQFVHGDRWTDCYTPYP